MSLHSSTSDSGFEDGPKQPALSALGRACEEKMRGLAAFVEQTKDLCGAADSMTDAEAKRLVEEVSCLAKDVAELGRWTKVPRRRSIEDATRQAEAYRELGDEAVRKLCHTLQKLPEGKPAKMRQLHIQAFEFMLKSKNNSLREATKKFCSCGNKRHDAKCSGRFKTGIRVLKKLLRKYAADLVVQYDSLHPDRKVRS